MQLSEATMSAIKQALEPAGNLIVERLGKMAKLILFDYGISTTDMPIEDIMAVGATARIGSLAAMGFFDYVPRRDGYSLAAEHVAGTQRDPTAAARMKKIGLVHDALLIDLHNFTPVDRMVDSAITANDDTVPFPPVTELTPCSEGAIRWAKELGSPLHYCSTSSPSLPLKDSKSLTTKFSLETIKEKELIEEKQMASLISTSAKSLGNRRRANEVNHSVYIQKKPNAKVWYHKAKALAALQNGTFFMPPKPEKKK